MEGSWRIGDVLVPQRVVTAPLAGISNPGFRKVMAGFGPGLMYTEMTSDKALLHHNKKTWKMLGVAESEGLVALQLFGSDPAEMAAAAQIVESNSAAAVIDINMGCPMTKVVRQGSGAALMKDPEKAAAIVRAVAQAVAKPVTVKIRSGWDLQSVNAPEFAKVLEESGAKAIAVHARTRSQLYEGHADWDIIRRVREAVRIPVIGNGDIYTPLDAERMLKETGCDAVMIGRGMLGNPWLIRDTVNYLRDGSAPGLVRIPERFAMMRLQAQSLSAELGERSGMKLMRSHACWYIRSLPHSNQVKARVSRINTYADLDGILAQYEKSLADGDYQWLDED